MYSDIVLGIISTDKTNSEPSKINLKLGYTTPIGSVNN